MSAENNNAPFGSDGEETPQAANDSDNAVNEVDALKAEVAAMKDRALRALAESENTRKRAEREKQEASQYSISRFARDLLSVADNLKRALVALPPDKRVNADDSVKAVLDGVEATERELQAMLTRHGVKPIDPKGERFDPHLHQAIAEVPGSGRPPGSVVDVVQTGYVIGDRLLRPAMVTVAKAGDGDAGGIDKRV